MPAKIENIEVLPNEILIKIFSYLSIRELIKVCAKVCKRFQELTHNEELWMRINLSEKNVDFDFIEYALDHGTKYLGLQRAQLCWPDSSNFQNWNKLKYLDLSHRAEGSELEIGR